MSVFTRLVGATTDGLLPPTLLRNRKNFAAVNVAQYVTGNGTTDDTTAVRAALTDALTNRRPIYFPDDLNIGVSDTIMFGDTRANSPQDSILRVEGMPRFKALSAIDGPVVGIQNTQSWSGRLHVDGAGVAAECVTMDTLGRASIDQIHTWGATTWGTRVLALGNNNCSGIGWIRSRFNGTKVDRAATATATTGGGSLAATTGVFGDGTEAGWTQFTLASAVSAHTTRQGAVKFVLDNTTGCVWRVRNFPSTTTVNLYNTRPTAGTVIDLTIPAGGGLNADKWGDSGCWNINQLDLRDNPNGMGLHWAGSYGMHAGALALQNNFFGIGCEQYMIGFAAPYAYFELTGIPLVVNDIANSRMVIGPGPHTAIDSVQIIGRNPSGLAGRNFGGETVQWATSRGQHARTTLRPSASSVGTSDIIPGYEYFFRRTSGPQAVRLNCTQWKEEGFLGADKIEVLVDLASASDTLNVTSITQGAGLTHTINGGSTATIAVTSTRSRITLIRTGTDWRTYVSPLN